MQNPYQYFLNLICKNGGGDMNGKYAKELTS